MTALRFENVEMVYGGSGRQVRALDGFNLEVATGEPVAVIGPSGCGKSTALLIAAGVIFPTGGQVLSGHKIVTSPRRETALILQDHGLLPWKTAEENAALGLLLRGSSRAEAHRVAGQALDRVGLGDFARAYPGELSGGMRQRVGMARAVALEADLLLMDEPLSAVDALTREDLQDFLLGLWQSRGHSQVLVTHSIEEAVFLGRRVVVMTARPGRIAHVVDNPEMGSEGHRSSLAFYERCAELRALLIAEGARMPGGAVVPLADEASAR